MSESGGMSVNCLTAGGQTVATDVNANITTLPANLRPAGATTAMNLTWDSDNKLQSADIDAGRPPRFDWACFSKVALIQENGSMHMENQGEASVVEPYKPSRPTTRNQTIYQKNRSMLGYITSGILGGLIRLFASPKLATLPAINLDVPFSIIGALIGIALDRYLTKASTKSFISSDD
jgi:hypothetical protein